MKNRTVKGGVITTANKAVRSYNESHEIKIDSNDSVVMYHVVTILSWIEQLNEDPIHSAKEYAKYQNELFKIDELIKAKNAITEVQFISQKGKTLRLTSELLIHFITNAFDFNQAKQNRGGRPKDSVISASYRNIKALRALNVPTEFIASLFKMEPETLQKALSRLQTKPTSKSL